MRLAERVRQPEYTGTNRCWPCTLVNAALVALVAGALAFVSLTAAVVVAAVGAATIAARGYIVPYTPRFAPRLIAALPGGERVFDHGNSDPAADSLGDEAAEGEHVLDILLNMGVLNHDADLDLAPEFRADWHAAMADLPPEELASACETNILGVGHARLYEDDNRTWVVVSDADQSVASETWLPLPAAIADVAAIRALTDRGVDPEIAANATAPLRLFLDECPSCGGGIVETAGDGCCGGFGPDGPKRVLACSACDQRVATLEPAAE